MLFIDTMHLEPPHLEWMHTELKQCGGAKVFRLVFGHYPIYSVGMYATCGSTKRTRDTLEPIFSQYGVHAYIGGHEHHMQAFEANGRHYIISGAVGELNRNGRIRKDINQDIVKYAYAGGPAFANFKFVDDGRLEYTFVDAADSGKVLYKASIKIEDAVYIGDGQGDQKSEKRSVDSQGKKMKPKVCDLVTTTAVPAENANNKNDDKKKEAGRIVSTPSPDCEDLPAEEWEDIDPIEAIQDDKSTNVRIISLWLSIGLLCLVL